MVDPLSDRLARAQEWLTSQSRENISPTARTILASRFDEFQVVAVRLESELDQLRSAQPPRVA